MNNLSPRLIGHTPVVFLLMIVAQLSFSSCERAFMYDSTATPMHTFDYLWQRVDQQYSMFDVKGVDWQAVYDSLRPQVTDTMGDDSLFALCASMLNCLNDGHVNLVSSFDASRSESVHHRFHAQSGIDVDLVVLDYLGVGYHSTGGMVHGPLCDGKVMYLYYGSFSNTVSVSGLRRIVDSYPEAQGMILDLRGNGGGNLANIDRILRVMPSHGQVLYRSQIKAGPAHDAFTPLEPTYAPQSVTDPFSLPVIVLVDRGCFSATSTIAIATQAYDNIFLMGDTTGGGLGLPTMGTLPNGWVYRFSITRTIALDGRNYENGVPPDILLPFDRERAHTLRRDNIIDSACALILGQSLVADNKMPIQSN